MSLSLASSSSKPAGHLNEASDAEVKDFIALLKPGVTSLVVFSAWVGLILAPGSLHPFLMGVALFSIFLGSGAAAALNMWYEKDTDALMRRTQRRPLPAGRIAPEEALSFSVILSGISVMLLGLSTNWVAAGWLAFTIFFYGVIYTMILKPRTAQNIVIGGAAGAFPPLIGWVAVTGEISLEPWLIVLIIFMWTPSHFWALALHRSSDYAKAGIPMLPVVKGLEKTRLYILFYAVVLVLSSSLPFFCGFFGGIYGSSATVLGALYLGYSWHLYREQTEKAALRLFSFSILYLFLLLAIMVLDHFMKG